MNHYTQFCLGRNDGIAARQMANPAHLQWGPIHPATEFYRRGYWNGFHSSEADISAIRRVTNDLFGTDWADTHVWSKFDPDRGWLYRTDHPGCSTEWMGPLDLIIELTTEAL